MSTKIVPAESSDSPGKPKSTFGSKKYLYRTNKFCKK